MQVKDHMSAIISGSKRDDPAPARVLLADSSEDCINQQINVEYTNCYLYHAMACYFSRDSVALHGFAAYFRHQSEDERHHAQLFMDFLSKRGGRVQLGALSAPPGVRAPRCCCRRLRRHWRLLHCTCCDFEQHRNVLCSCTAVL